MTDPDARMKPHDRDAERSVLGGILRHPCVFASVLAILRPEDFYLYPQQCIFRAMIQLDHDRMPIDLVMIHDHLSTAKQLADVGGVAYLAELWDAIPAGANAEYHAQIVRDKSITRQLIHVGNEIIRDGHDQTSSAADQLAEAERKIFEIAEGAIAETRFQLLSEVCRDMLIHIDERATSGGSSDGLPTGYADLDNVLGGLKPGHLIAVGARTSVGKTALALNIAANVATAGTPVLFFSLEMPARELGVRMLAMGSGVPMHRFIRSAAIDPRDMDALARAAGPAGIGHCPLWIDDESSQSAAHLAAGLRRAIRQHRIGLAVVDYLQLMIPDDRRENRATQISAFTRALKIAARDCNVPILLLAQLNRELERENRKPRLSDFRECGSIEQDCDSAILLHRPADQATDDPVWLIEVNVAKNRNGPTGEVTLAYRRAVTRFENAARGQGW